MGQIARRRFLLAAGFAGAGAISLDSLIRGYKLFGTAASKAQNDGSRLGPLVPTASRNTKETLLALPKDFNYTVFGKTGDLMSDGTRTPRAHDGMAAFQSRRQLRLVRNHEINNQVGTSGAGLAERSYDPLAGGGTTTLIVDPKSRELRKSFVSLSGTLVNCAGGATPWNSWISCEETVLGERKFKNRYNQDQGGFSKPHGYCFEVPAFADGPVNPTPIKAMGRFVHEAIAVDPQTGIVYLTEDLVTCGFYRFLPNRTSRLGAGGRLQMLAVKNKPQFNTTTQQKEGLSLPVTWVDIPDPDPSDADFDNLSVYRQGLERGGATFCRLEGCLFGLGKVFFTSTSGGDRKLGQVWEYQPGSGANGGLLTLLLEPTDPALLNMPDNISLTRTGGLVICEDNSTSVHLQLFSSEREMASLARNIVLGFETQEFAGVTFSPDFETLFVNIQVPGLTFAIWGPWDRL